MCESKRSQKQKREMFNQACAAARVAATHANAKLSVREPEGYCELWLDFESRVSNTVGLSIIVFPDGTMAIDGDADDHDEQKTPNVWRACVLNELASADKTLPDRERIIATAANFNRENR